MVIKCVNLSTFVVKTTRPFTSIKSKVKTITIMITIIIMITEEAKEALPILTY